MRGVGAFSNRVNQFLGKISYEVYLVHSTVIEVRLPLLPQWGSGVITYNVAIAAATAMNAVDKRLVALAVRT